MQKIIDKMQKADLPAKVIADFLEYRQEAMTGRSNYLSESQIQPLTEQDTVKYETLPRGEKSESYRAVVIKLNGGLGTSMGLQKAKSLIKVKDGLTFLDIIARQILTRKPRLPLMLMNSFATDADSLHLLQEYPKISEQGLPLSFLQNRYPRLMEENLSLCEFTNEVSNWAPPGHGDIYTVLQERGLLKELLAQGIDYAFISNSDNLGASFDEKILHYFAKSNLDFMMEVCRRTPMDKKGGHLCKQQGKITLRELAQTKQEDVAEFQNIDKHQFFNTNNLWVNLRSLKALKNFKLPLIVNSKSVCGKKVVQLETAMGSAISVFAKSKVLLVPRSRFLPVKKTNDLLLIRSDFFNLTEDFKLSASALELPIIEVNPDYYGTLAQLESKVKVVPSLRECTKLVLKNDYLFDKPHRFVGNCII